MIKVDAKTRTVRETTAPYSYAEKGEIKTEQIRVLYHSFTWNELQTQHAALQKLSKDNPDATVWPHESLVERLHSLPDLSGPDGKAFKITAKNLGDLDTKNLEAIKTAIDNDFSGKSQAAK